MISVLSAVLVIYAGLAAAIWLGQGRLVYQPTRTLASTPADVGLPCEELWLHTADGVRIHGWLVPGPSRQDGPFVLFCHGNAGNIGHRLQTLLLFHKMGLSTCIFDYRGYGLSQGSPDEEGTSADARAAWAYLTDTRAIQPERIVLWGRSLGGAVAARLARETRPGALIVESGFTSVPDLGARIYPIFPVRLLCRFDYDTRACVAAAPCPVLVVHSPDDEIIPYAMGRRIYDAAPGFKRFLDIAGSHNTGFIESAEGYTRGVRSFLAEALVKP